jgi:uncharacterized OB-fold protein
MHEKLVIKKFWDYLKEGRIMTLKCKKCGTYVFPPVPTCNKCFSRDLEWVELSGDGKLLYFTTTLAPAKPFTEFVPFGYGIVKLKEGPLFITRVDGLDVSKPERIQEGIDRLPLDVKAEITKVGELPTITFRVVSP